MGRDSTAVRISKETWSRLSDLKSTQGPGDTFDDVISDLLDAHEGDLEVSDEEVTEA